MINKQTAGSENNKTHTYLVCRVAYYHHYVADNVWRTAKVSYDRWGCGRRIRTNGSTHYSRSATIHKRATHGYRVQRCSAVLLCTGIVCSGETTTWTRAGYSTAKQVSHALPQLRLLRWSTKEADIVSFRASDFRAEAMCLVGKGK